LSNPLQQTIEALAKEKGIEPDVVISAIEEAVATASRKYYKTGENLKTRFNTETGQVDLFALKTVVEEVVNPAIEISIDEARATYRNAGYGDDVVNSIELGDEMEFPKATEVLGRIAAQTAKQVIFQKVREAERENIFAEYNQRIGEVVNGTVKRFENGDIILEVGRIEAVLPRKEQSRAESYTPGDRVRTVIKGVNRSAKGPQIVLSRTDPALLIKLFEQEVPEIYDGTVMIRGAVREAGDRAKVAVFSRERDVDPVGACVGMKGTRVQSIIRELRGEKIDIVEWSEDPIAFVTNALSPAKVQRVSIVDDRDRVMEVIVEDKQLSLAIGKKGQNVRLAAKLTGWRIDIKSEEEKRREVEAQFEGLELGSSEPEQPATSAADEGEALPPEAVASDVPVPYTLAGVGEKVVRKLVEAGFDTQEAVAASSVEQLSEIPGIGDKTAEKILTAARGEAPVADANAGAIESDTGDSQS
jgi:transcription termination/antitermination protein NusA